MKNRRIFGGAFGAIVLILLAATCKYADPGAVGSPPEDPDDGEPGTVTSTIRVTGVSIDKELTRGIYKPGDTDVLIAAIEPENATNQAVTWTSSNSEVAMITSEEGSPLCTFECGEEGFSDITVTTWEGDKKARYRVIVQTDDPNPDVVYPTGFYTTFLPEIVVMYVGEERYENGLSSSSRGGLEQNILPNGNDKVDRTLIRASSNTDVFTLVDDGTNGKNGRLLAVGVGEAVWSATTVNGLVCEVPVKVVKPKSIEMVKIPGGTFTMRGTTGVDITVTVTGFMMSKYPITQEQWESVMGTSPSLFKGPDLPVETVDFESVIRFCNRLSDMEWGTTSYGAVSPYSPFRWRPYNTSKNYRLPTEAEWEYACRAGSILAYSTDLGTGIEYWQANFNTGDGNSVFQTTPVGSYAPNAWGLYDMHGNVSEFCWGRDMWTPYSDTTNPYIDSDLVYRTYLDDGCPIAIRGGSWNDPMADLSSGRRKFFNIIPDPAISPNALSTIGFRVVRAIGPGD